MVTPIYIYHIIRQQQNFLCVIFIIYLLRGPGRSITCRQNVVPEKGSVDDLQSFYLPPEAKFLSVNEIQSRVKKIVCFTTTNNMHKK